MILLDSNVLSELMRPAPSHAVVAWMNVQTEEQLWTSAITIFEIEYGIELIDDGARRLRLRSIFESIINQEIGGRILPFDAESAARTAAISALGRKQGRTIELRDAMIAGIALRHHCTLATHNVRHFDECDVELINPWSP